MDKLATNSDTGTVKAIFGQMPPRYRQTHGVTSVHSLLSRLERDNIVRRSPSIGRQVVFVRVPVTS